MKIVPDDDALLRAIPEIKERLSMNVELATPDDSIPVRPGWEDRCPFVTQEGRVSFHPFDFEAQALAKIERGHRQDLEDVHAMLTRGLVTPEGLREAFWKSSPIYTAIRPSTPRHSAAPSTTSHVTRTDSSRHGPRARRIQHR